MRVSIRDKGPLSEISPAALSAYARATGWTRTDNYGDSSDVYVSDGLPEIILPRTQRLGDYANVVSQLIDIFADVAGTDELSLYRDLVTADRDVIRVRAAEGVDGAVSVGDGIDLVCGAHDMILAAACSLHDPRAVYRAGANKQATDFVRNIRMGQTEQGSFVVTLLTPVISPPMQKSFIPGLEHNDPIERKITRRLATALRATQHATESLVGGDSGSFFEAVDNGVSANLCEALVRLIEPFTALDVSLTWARTHPMNTAREVVHFGKGDAPILREAARLFRDRGPQPDVQLYGFVQRLKRDKEETDGTITLRAYIDDRMQSVVSVLSQSDYSRAIKAHEQKALVVAEGDLERTGQRWHLLNPRVVAVIPQKDMQEEGE